MSAVLAPTSNGFQNAVGKSFNRSALMQGQESSTLPEAQTNSYQTTGTSPGLQLVFPRQNALFGDKLFRNGIQYVVHVAVKNQPFIVTLSLPESSGMDSENNQSIDFKRMAVEAKLLYDCDPLKEVDFVKLKPLEYKCHSVNDRGDQLTVELRIKVLSSQLEDMCFRVRFSVIQSDTKVPVSGLEAISDPIKVVSKPDQVRKRRLSSGSNKSSSNAVLSLSSSSMTLAALNGSPISQLNDWKEPKPRQRSRRQIPNGKDRGQKRLTESETLGNAMKRKSIEISSKLGTYNEDYMLSSSSSILSEASNESIELPEETSIESISATTSSCSSPSLFPSFSSASILSSCSLSSPSIPLASCNSISSSNNVLTLNEERTPEEDLVLQSLAHIEDAVGQQKRLLSQLVNQRRSSVILQSSSSSPSPLPSPQPPNLENMVLENSPAMKALDSPECEQNCAIAINGFGSSLGVRKVLEEDASTLTRSCEKETGTTWDLMAGQRQGPFDYRLHSFLRRLNAIEANSRPHCIRQLLRRSRIQSEQEAIADLFEVFASEQDLFQQQLFFERQKQLLSDATVNVKQEPCLCEDCPHKEEIEHIHEFYSEFFNNNEVLF